MKMADRSDFVVAVSLLALASCRLHEIEDLGTIAPPPGPSGPDGAVPIPEDGAGTVADATVVRADASAEDASHAPPTGAGTGLDGGPRPGVGPVDAAGEACARALMVVGTAQLTATDRAVRARLAAKMMVDVLPEAMAETADAGGRALVVNTASATVAGTGTKFRDVDVPIILLEPNLMGIMQMTAEPAAAHGATPPVETMLTIAAPGHPLAAGLENDVTVYRTPWRLTWGIPGSQAMTVAHLVNRPDHHVIFAYEPRTMMVGIRAPARRLGFFLHDNVVEDLTAQALALLDAAIAWMVDTRLPPCAPAGGGAP
jgi:hypothetical protein